MGLFIFEGVSEGYAILLTCLTIFAIMFGGALLLNYLQSKLKEAQKNDRRENT